MIITRKTWQLHHYSADLLARLYYGLQPPPIGPRADGRQNNGPLIAMRHLRKRGALTDDNQVTEHGVKLLQLHVEGRKT